MAVLTPQQVDQIRHAYARVLEQETGVAHLRPALNAAIQAVEDALAGNTVQNALSAAIDAAIAPATMTQQHKRRLIKQVIVSLGERISN